MIETREEYERAKYVARVIMGPTTRKAMKTVDALLKMTRAAHDRSVAVSRSERRLARIALREALDGLPPWMKRR